jgi:parvulin-like peptidyl-prolyl isomerase
MVPMSRLSVGLLIFSAALLLPGCGWGGRIQSLLFDDDTGAGAVQVGKKYYGLADLDRFFDSRLSEFRNPADADKVKSNLLDSFIEERLLLTEAENHRVEPNRELLKKMMSQIAASSAESSEAADPRNDPELERNLVESLKMQQYLHDHLLKDISITEEQCEAYYQQHMSEFIRNDVLHLREILVEDEAQAQKIKASLTSNRSKNFAELARLFSKAPSAAEGGDLGSFQRGDLPQEFETVVFALQPGSASKIVRTKYGFHIFLVEEKVQAHQQKFWEVKEQIKERLQQDRERELISQELAALAGRIPVVIHMDKLDFKYISTRFPVR